MTRELKSFKDILESRREEHSNFMWISRKLNTVVAYKQSVKPTPKNHKKWVLKSSRIQDLIVKVSETQNLPKEKVEHQVKLILDEIGFNKQLSVIRWLGLFLTKISIRVCKGIHVNEEHILRTKKLMGNTPTMFLPSHRSYADFILMSYVCFTYDIEIPAIAAGMDFHGMWGMGTILRDTGAFFMRRSYNNDSLYWDTFRQYVHQLVTKGELPIEFFIEGTRSRTGKSLTPKYGLLSMVLKPFLMGEVPDMLFVPINISYERVLEERLFAFELLGVPKPKESTSGFFKSLSLVAERYGNIYVDFGEPISAKAFFNNQIDRSVHNLKPSYAQEITQKEKDYVLVLAHNIVQQQQKCSIITTFNIVALSLMNNYLSGLGEMMVEELVEDVMWLNKILKELNALSDLNNPKPNVLESLDIHKGLVRVNLDGRVTIVKNLLTLNNTDTGKLKGHSLSQDTMTHAIPFVMLQIYVNPVLHYIENLSLIVTILKHHSGISNDVLFGHFGFLRSLLSYEFVAIESQDYLSYCDSLRNLNNLGLIESTEGRHSLSNNQAAIKLFYNVIEPFLYIYYVTCMTLSSEAFVMNERNITKSVQAFVENFIKQKQFVHPYCLNLDSISNCLSRLTIMEVLTKQKINNSIVYEANLDKLENITKILGNYVKWKLEEEDLCILQTNVRITCKL